MPTGHTGSTRSGSAAADSARQAMGIGQRNVIGIGQHHEEVPLATWLPFPVADSGRLDGHARRVAEELMARLAAEDDEFGYDGALDVEVRNNVLRARRSCARRRTLMQT